MTDDELERLGMMTAVRVLVILFDHLGVEIEVTEGGAEPAPGPDASPQSVGLAQIADVIARNGGRLG